jgi:hypothetical protein
MLRHMNGGGMVGGGTAITMLVLGAAMFSHGLVARDVDANPPAAPEPAAVPAPGIGNENAVRGDAEQARRTYDGYVWARVGVRTFRDMQVCEQLGQMASCRGGVGVEVDYIFSPEAFEALRGTDIPFVIVHHDVGRLLRDERAEIERRDSLRGLTFFENYRPLAEIHGYIEQLAAENPNLASTFTLGNSPGGDGVQYNIPGIRISSPDLPGNPRSTRPQIFFNGCQHAREWVSPATVTYIADQLLEQYSTNPRVRAILDQVEFLIVPVVNPEGYVHTWNSDRLWRKNRRTNSDNTRGVDLNRNWGFQWGLNSGSSASPSSETYRGTAAFSEVETQRLRDFITANGRIRAHIDFHSFSQLILSPWGYVAGTPTDNSVFAELNPQMSIAIGSVALQTYRAGPGGATLYLASGIAPDWSFGSRGIWSWTIELRDTGQFGFVLPPEQILPTGRENFAGVLVLGEYVAQPFRFSFPDGLPTSGQAGVPQTIRVNITDNNRGVIDPATAKVLFRTSPSGGFQSATMTQTGVGEYTATLPAFRCATSVTYYFEAGSTDGRFARYPSQAARGLSTSLLTRSTTGTESEVFFDSFETNQGWTFGVAGDTAPRGIWQRCDPEPTSAQPANDFSPTGTLAAITDCRGGAVGDWDVDAGVTTLLSPVIDARPPRGYDATDMFVRYARWYSNDRGGAPNADSMPVEISGDNGATWVQLENVTENLNAWSVKTFRISDFVTPTAQVRLRFVARDLASGSVVEAGVDDVRVFAFGCPCPADFNGDGGADFFDYLDFVSAFDADAPAADFNNDGAVDFFDYLDFVTAYDLGCE